MVPLASSRVAHVIFFAPGLPANPSVFDQQQETFIRRAHRVRCFGHLNSPEAWFGIVARQSIRRGTFTSVQVLIRQIRDYIAYWNNNPEPFVWTATADEILAKVRIVQTGIKKLVDNNKK